MNRKKLLIIKHGDTATYSKSSITARHDHLLACTTLLEAFKAWKVTWITNHQARWLLQGNHLIDELIIAETPLELTDKTINTHYHAIVNLEKRQDWCQFGQNISTDIRYGYENWNKNKDQNYYLISRRHLSHKYEYRPIQEKLFELVAKQWHGEKYVLGYQPKVSNIYDVGLLPLVDENNKNRAWPKQMWYRLYERLNSNYALAWQGTGQSQKHFIDWIASCRLIVACDSLAMELAIALNKKVVALFGPTAAEEIYLYGCGIKLTPPCDRLCIPCAQSQCLFDESCMDYISVNMVQEAIELVLHGQTTSKTTKQDFSKTPILSEAGR